MQQTKSSSEASRLHHKRTSVIVAHRAHGTIQFKERFYAHNLPLHLSHPNQLHRGVELAAAGSPVLDSLKALELKGTRLVLCSTCLDYYGLTDKAQIGIVGGMTDIIEAQRLARKVISI